MTRDSHNTGSPDTLILRRLQRTFPKVQTHASFTRTTTDGESSGFSCDPIMMKTILRKVMAGLFLFCFLAACEEHVPSPPASTPEPNLVQEHDDPAQELVLLETLREAEGRGRQDSGLAAALHNVGELYRVQGDLAAAEPYFWRALPVWAASVGATDPRMALSLSSLALVFETRKDYAKAIPLVEQALNIREMAYGVDHPRLIPSLEQYAGLLRLVNRIEEAEQIDARRARIAAL